MPIFQPMISIHLACRDNCHWQLHRPGCVSPCVLSRLRAPPQIRQLALQSPVSYVTAKTRYRLTNRTMGCRKTDPYTLATSRRPSPATKVSRRLLTTQWPPAAGTASSSIPNSTVVVSALPCHHKSTNVGKRRIYRGPNCDHSQSQPARDFNRVVPLRIPRHLAVITFSREHWPKSAEVTYGGK